MRRQSDEPPRLVFPRRALARLCEAQNWRCAYCGADLKIGLEYPRHHPARPTFDEVVPRSKGGKAIWENQVAACARCNNTRRSEDAYEFALSRQASRPAPPATMPPMRPKEPAPIVIEMSAARRAYFEMTYGHRPEFVKTKTAPTKGRSG